MKRSLGLVIMVLLLTGCRSTPVNHMISRKPHLKHTAVEKQSPARRVQQVDHAEEVDNDQSVGLAQFAEELNHSSSAQPLTLPEFEQLALDINPAVAELDAELESLRGKLTQAGLPPNPVVGINGEDINENGGAGRYGVYFGRQVVRGDKLALSRSVVSAEIKVVEQRRKVVVRKLLTDVRQAFFNLLIVQERIKTIKQLVEISEQAVDTSKKLLKAEEIAQTSLLQAELELQNAQVFVRQAENQKLGVERQLAALIGKAELPFDSIVGDVHSFLELEEFEISYDQLVRSSPEIAALFADVEQQRRNLCRQIAEPIPNVTWQSTLQFDIASDDIVAGFQIGMPIPTLNRNEGAIHQARHKIVSAERKAERKALDLRQRLAKAYQDYIDSQIQVEAFENEIIPKARKTVELISDAYREGEMPFLQWLTAQRTYSQTQLTYLSQLQTLWEQHWAVKGLLLSGSLQD